MLHLMTNDWIGSTSLYITEHILTNQFCSCPQTTILHSQK